MTSSSENPKKTGRPKKATTVVQRQINVYLPDMVMVTEWKRMAKEYNQSVSKFVMERVEDSLKKNGEGQRYTRKDLADRLYRLEDENRELRKDLEMKTKAYHALDIELKDLRTRPFLTPMEEGARKISQDLVSLIRSRKRIDYNEILPAMNIKPTEIDLIKSVTTQIEQLVHAGVVKQDLKGWVWVK